MEDKIKDISDLRLIVIDTLKMFRPVVKGTKGIYDADYEPIAAIKGIADKYNVSILIIHHLRKSDSDDVFDTMSGSLGLTGATDTNLILQRKTGQADAILHVTGRDVESAEYALHFEPSILTWQMLGGAYEVQTTGDRQALYDAIKDYDCPVTIPKLAEATGLKYKFIQKALTTFLKDGQVKRRGRGVYEYNDIPL